jgi:hypothetical protein
VLRRYLKYRDRLESECHYLKQIHQNTQARLARETQSVDPGRRSPVPGRHSPTFSCGPIAPCPSLAVGGQGGHLEAVMAGAERNRWLIGAGWMAGISIVLVEMQVCMDYVQARVMEQAKMVADWLPMIGTLLCNFKGFVLPQFAGAQAIAWRFLLSAIPVGLAVLGWMLKSWAAD